MKSWSFPALLVFALPACINNGDDDSTTAVQTTSLVAVSPDSFLGVLGPVPVACEPGDGGMQSYVATFRDVNASDGGLIKTLKSSGPIPCTQTVAAGSDGTRGEVVIGHTYEAQIDGYDRADIHPADPDAGTPAMLGPDDAPVAPRWTIVCRDPRAECEQYATQYVGCSLGDGGAVMNVP
jgi:hypothetical protein